MNKYMEIALKEARKSLKTDDIPIGAVIVENDKIIAKGHNTREKNHIITHHAEINAVESACKKKKTWHLSDCEIYITLEPCPMCLEILKQAHIKTIYYAAEAKKKVNYKPIPKIKIKNVEKNKESEKLITEFFKNKRK